jgi:hypothetical protein
MHVHLPKPLHGWRAFAGEVGIIVLGILIALSAEQLVDNLRWRREIHSFRSALDEEIGRDLGVTAANLAQRPCASRRLDELETLLAASTSGQTPKLLQPIGQPLSFSSYFSVWDNKGADVTAHLPSETRFQYGEVYDELRNQETARLAERDIWRQLGRFDQPEPLDHADRMQLRELLNRAKRLEALAPLNDALVEKLAGQLGIAPIDDPSLHLPRDVSFCSPLLAK